MEFRSYAESEECGAGVRNLVMKGQELKKPVSGGTVDRADVEKVVAGRAEGPRQGETMKWSGPQFTV